MPKQAESEIHPPAARFRQQIAALVLPLFLVGVAHAQAQTGSVVGVVVDQRTQQPVAAATVTVSGVAGQIATDAAGRFQIRSLVPGKHLLRIEHLAYGRRELELTVHAGAPTEVQLALTETAIALQPLNVEVITAEERQARAAGFQRRVVTREQIAAAEGTYTNLADVLRHQVPNVRVRRQERMVGSPICIELRTIRTTQGTGACLSPAVYLDGTPVSNPTTLYNSLPVEMIEKMEIIPAAEAGVRFGSGALYGALLIHTRKPGAEQQPKLIERKTNFDWNTDAEGHRTTLVFATSAAGNALGLLAGVAIAKECLRLRAPSNDGLVSDCSTAATLATAAGALILPALGNGLGSRLAGQTQTSQGLLAPATLGATMMLVPGYALVFTGKRNKSDSLQNVGYGVMVLGPPVIATAADYLFRRRRSRGD